MPTKNKERHRDYQRKHYLANSEYYKNKRKLRAKAMVVFFKSVKSALSCALCEEDDQATFDFHHFDASLKLKEINLLVRNGISKSRLIVELEKCVCLCANCHRKVHTYQEWADKLASKHLIVISKLFEVAV